MVTCSKLAQSKARDPTIQSPLTGSRIRCSQWDFWSWMLYGTPRQVGRWKETENPKGVS